MATFKKVVWELHQALSKKTVSRLFAYLSFLQRKGEESKKDVLSSILELVRQGTLPYRATEQELHDVVAEHFVFKVPSWATIDKVDGIPVVALCASRECGNSEVSLSGEGNFNGAPTAGWLVRGSGKRFYCSKCRGNKRMKDGDYVGYHSASSAVNAYREKSRRSMRYEEERRARQHEAHPFRALREFSFK